uniref:SWIM-type domain-containing protein n=1 Tax=Arundo donax TaxID=35708 RepID=A0A0A9HV19_ARUDO
MRMYICFDACKRGFLARCRKVIGLDGCFFKGPTTGELICAMGRDGNNQMYPIAWVVVEKETNESWDWFCDLLFRDLYIGDGEGWVIISDQQKGLINAVENWVPQAEHWMCARHIYANWRKRFKDRILQKKFWRCAKAPCLNLFNYHKADLAKDAPAGAEAIMRTDPQHWSRAWFKLGSNCDSVDNMCESFNHSIVESRFLPIISMLEWIRCKVMVRIQVNWNKADRWTGQICPNILKKLNGFINESVLCHAIYNGSDSYEVSHREERFSVNLDTKTCSCRYWQLSGLPCPHAISAIHWKTSRLDDYIASCYSI